MATIAQKLAGKRQEFHKLLIALGEVKHKEVIVSSWFGVDSTTELTEIQLDTLIADAHRRLNRTERQVPRNENTAAVKKWRNKCLLVLAERGIIAKPKDWSAINHELEKKQYQWVVPTEMRFKGYINRKGLYAFVTAETLKKLFNQLVAIRDNERKKAASIKFLTFNN